MVPLVFNMQYIEDLICLLKKETFVREKLIHLLKREIFIREFVNSSVNYFFEYVCQGGHDNDICFAVKNRMLSKFKSSLNWNISEREIDSLLKPVYWGLMLGKNSYITSEHGFDAVKNSTSIPTYSLREGLRDKLREDKGQRVFLDGIVKEIFVKNKITFYARLNGHYS